RVWRQMDRSIERKQINLSAVKVILLWMVAIVTYVGIRLVPLPQIDRSILIGLMVIGVITIIARQAVFKIIANAVLYASTRLSKRESIRRDQGHQKLSRLSQVAIVLCVLILSIIVSLASL